jgi:hypothetical protein
MRTLLAVLLVAGVVLLGVGAVMHPMLDGSAADQLRLIAATSHWRALHLAMLAGSACLIAGIWVRQLDGSAATPAVATPALATPALATIALGLALNAFDIGVMASAGTHMAAAFVAGNATMPAVYEATHLIGVMTARFGNAVVALGAVLLGSVEWATPGRRWAAILAWVAAAGGLVGVLAFDETSRGILGAVALLCGWSALTGIQALRTGDRSLH